MKESKTRSFVKCISYRIWGTLTTSAIAFIFTGSAQSAVTFGFLDLVAKTFLYFGHERIWSTISWGYGKTDKKEVVAKTHQLNEQLEIKEI